jgi:hypothetical protein
MSTTDCPIASYIFRYIILILENIETITPHKIMNIGTQYNVFNQLVITIR